MNIRKKAVQAYLNCESGYEYKQKIRPFGGTVLQIKREGVMF